MFRTAVIISLVFAGLFVSLALPSHAVAQAGTGNIRADKWDDQNFPNMTASIHVVDANGIPLTGLSNDKFLFFEEGRNVAVDVKETLKPDQPVSVLLVLDKSGSMSAKSATNSGKTKLDDAKDAAIRFIQRLQPTDRAGILAFGDSVDLNTGLSADCVSTIETKELAFTSDGGALINCINTITTLANQVTTPLYDAAYKAVIVTALEARSQQNTPVVILFTDGQEGDRQGKQVSENPRVAAELAARADHVAIFTVGVGADADLAYLKAVAESTGGEFGQAIDAAKLDSFYGQVVDRLRTRYDLAWRSDIDADGKEHQLDIKVKAGTKELANQITFVARRPLKPGIRLQYQKPSGLFQGDVTETTAAITGQEFLSTWTLVPEIIARNDIKKVEYYLDRATKPAYVAEAFPWNLPWPATGENRLPQPKQFNVRVVAYDADGNSGETSIDLLVRQGGINLAWIAAIVGLILLTALVALIFALRGRAHSDQNTDDTPLLGGAVPEPIRVPVAYLGVIEGPDCGRQFTLASVETHVGRNPGNDIVLVDPTVGRDHVLIRYENGGFVLHALPSLNPPRVNEMRVQEWRLSDKDRIDLGNSVLIFRSSLN